MAVYGYTVKYKGVYYPAGMEVPDEEVKKKVEVEKKTSALLDDEEVIPKKRAGRPKKEQ